MMHVAVLGAGVIGVTTAYYLAEHGHSVTIIDRESAVAAATSHANGGQLSYSYIDSLARPEFLLQIPSLLFGLDPAIHIRVLRNFAMFGWGIDFLAQCTRARARNNTIAVLKLALRSAVLIEALQQKLNLDFSYSTAGKLVLLADKNELRKAQKKMRLKQKYGCETHVLTPREAIDQEPAIQAMQQDFAGAMYAKCDQVGDARAFTVGLSEWLQQNRPVTLRLDEEISNLVLTNAHVTGVQTAGASIDADAVVVCLGAWSGGLLRGQRLKAPLYPVRGYSVTLPRGASAPAVSVTNLKHRIVFSQLDNRVRIAGFADFVGFDTRRDERRIETLLRTAERVAPLAADYGAKQKAPWGGFRPMTPTGRPLLGASKIDGLFLNTGHGSLGWTLACATADYVADAISNPDKRGQ